MSRALPNAVATHCAMLYIEVGDEGDGWSFKAPDGYVFGNDSQLRFQPKEYGARELIDSLTIFSKKPPR